VSQQLQKTYRRVFARRELFAGPSRLGLFWSLIAGLALLLLLGQVALLVGLLTDRGRVALVLSEDDVPAFRASTGIPLALSSPPPPVVNPADVAAGNVVEEVQTQTVMLDDTGILPSIWRLRHQGWSNGLFWVYREVPSLRSNITALMALLAGLAIAALVRLFALSRMNLQARRASLEAGARLQKSLHRQTLRLGPEDLDGRVTERAMQLFTTEVDTVAQSLYERIRRLLREPVELFVLILVAFLADALLALQWIVPIGFGFVLWYRGRRHAVESRLLAADRMRSEFRTLGQWLRNSRLVRGYGMEATEQTAFENQLERFVESVRRKSRLEDVPLWYGWWGALAAAAVCVFLMMLLGTKILSPQPQLSFPGAFLVLSVVPLALASAHRLGEVQRISHEMNVAADQIFRFLDQLPTVSQAVGAKFLNPLSRTLHFEGVTYQSPDKELLLDRIDLKLEAGKSYAVVSLNREEARAFLLMLPRFLEPKAGRILFDGEDIAWMTLESLRAETAYIGTDDPPFVGSVLQNLRAGSDYSLSRVTDAAKAVHAHNFISQLSHGYETVLSGADDTLSVGQRFRLGLARALARDPALLVIEEPQGPLDEDTKHYLVDAYERLLAKRTVFFLPTRMSTLRRVDAVILLHKGRVMAVGPQSELISSAPVYRHWEYLHFNEFRHLADSEGA